MAELDAALRAAMDGDWDGLPSAPCRAPAGSSTAHEHAQSDAPGLVDEAAVLDAALRAAMDDDWEGRGGSDHLAAAALPALADDAASRCPTSMGYMALDGSAAAALMPGATMGAMDLSAGHGDASYCLPRLDDDFMLPTLSDEQQREQMEEIQRTLAHARSASGPAEL